MNEDKQTEVIIEEIAIEEIMNDLENIYSIPETIAKKYLTEDTNNLVNNTVEAMWKAQEQELEEWIQSIDILKHQDLK